MTDCLRGLFGSGKKSFENKKQLGLHPMFGLYKKILFQNNTKNVFLYKTSGIKIYVECKDPWPLLKEDISVKLHLHRHFPKTSFRRNIKHYCYPSACKAAI